MPNPLHLHRLTKLEMEYTRNVHGWLDACFESGSSPIALVCVRADDCGLIMHDNVSKEDMIQILETILDHLREEIATSTN
jgi:hypothetical protein